MATTTPRLNSPVLGLTLAWAAALAAFNAEHGKLYEEDISTAASVTSLPAGAPVIPTGFAPLS